VNSLKNTVVIVLLLGVSYGVFQLVNAPKNDVAIEDPVDLDIEDFGDEGADEAADSAGDFNHDLADQGNKAAEPLPKLPDFVPNPNNLQPNPAGGNQPGNLARNEGLPDANQWPKSDSLPNADKVVENELPQANFSPDSSQDPSFTGPLNSVELGKLPPQNNDPPAFAGPNELVPIPKNAPSDSQQNLLADSGSAQGQPLSPTMSSAKPRPLPFQYVPTADELEKVWPQARKLVSEKNFAGALSLLSKFNRSKMGEAQRVELMNWLDSLAGKVVYSSEHLLTGSPYVVRQGDTLESLASQWRVPQELIYNTNRKAIGQTQNLVPGTQLKQVQGPFRAEISASDANSKQGEMTIYLGDLYAGRFQLDFGEDVQIQPGEYVVQTKTNQGRAYRNATGQTVQAGSSGNPYGNFWMDLGGGVCIHAKNSIDGRGCIRVNDSDVADVFGILGNQSRVIIR
jgi:LysM repeat protein